MGGDLKPRDRSVLLGYLMALAATIIWSGNFIVARGLADSIPPAVLAFGRWSIAVLVMLPFGARSIWKERHRIRDCLGYLCLTALVGITVFNTLIYIAGRTTSAVNLSLIAAATPVFVVILARLLLKERITWRKALGIVLALPGVAVLLTQGDPARILRLDFTEGDLWMVLAAIAFAVYSVLVKRKPGGLGDTVFLLTIFILGLVFLAPWAAWQWLASPKIVLSGAIVGSMVYVGVGAAALAFYLWNRAIGLVGAGNAALVYYTLPLFSTIEAILILSEPVRWAHMVGGTLIITGVLAASLRRS